MILKLIRGLFAADFAVDVVAAACSLGRRL